MKESLAVNFTFKRHTPNLKRDVDRIRRKIDFIYESIKPSLCAMGFHLAKHLAEEFDNFNENKKSIKLTLSMEQINV